MSLSPDMKTKFTGTLKCVPRSEAEQVDYLAILHRRWNKPVSIPTSLGTIGRVSLFYSTEMTLSDAIDRIGADCKLRNAQTAELSWYNERTVGSGDPLVCHYLRWHRATNKWDYKRMFFNNSVAYYLFDEDTKVVTVKNMDSPYDSSK